MSFNFIFLLSSSLNVFLQRPLAYGRCFTYCRDNFLKIHLYYGDISYNSLEQSPAYDVKSLLSMFLSVLSFSLAMWIAFCFILSVGSLLYVVFTHIVFSNLCISLLSVDLCVIDLFLK